MNETLAMINRWCFEAQEVAVFTPEAPAALIHSRKLPRFNLHFAMSEQYTPALVASVISKSEVRASEKIIVCKALLDLQPVELAILERLLARWDFDLVESGHEVDVWEVVQKRSAKRPFRLSSSHRGD
ncbi:MAG: hypothetical protein KatS3mg105_4095 [Gemmatales bacterium]|nr:MAG: hypothetical protein KatS3mg105_4095 [Gemmatales bacterium]